MAMVYPATLEHMARILVIDDEPLVARVIQRALKIHEVDVAPGGLEGLAMHRREPYPLAIVDIHLGDASGPVLAVRLGQVSPVRVILMSGDQEADGWDGDLLVKPFRIEQLQRMVDRLLTLPPV